MYLSPAYVVGRSYGITFAPSGEAAPVACSRGVPAWLAAAGLVAAGGIAYTYALAANDRAAREAYARGRREGERRTSASAFL